MTSRTLNSSVELIWCLLSGSHLKQFKDDHFWFSCFVVVCFLGFFPCLPVSLLHCDIISGDTWTNISLPSRDLLAYQNKDTTKAQLGDLISCIAATYRSMGEGYSQIQKWLKHNCVAKHSSIRECSWPANLEYGTQSAGASRMGKCHFHVAQFIWASSLQLDSGPFLLDRLAGLCFF